MRTRSGIKEAVHLANGLQCVLRTGTFANVRFFLSIFFAAAVLLLVEVCCWLCCSSVEPHSCKLRLCVQISLRCLSLWMHAHGGHMYSEANEPTFQNYIDDGIDFISCSSLPHLQVL